MIGLLFTFLGVLISPFGLMAFMGGFILFFLLPFVPRATGMFPSFARFHQKLAGNMLSRAAIVVSEQGDLLLKRMTPDDTGIEKISFDDVKEFEDTNEASSWWLNMRFALADEPHGFLFTPLHAAVGWRKIVSRQDGEMTAKATEAERDSYGVGGWVKGFFEFETGVHELVNLNDARHLVPGSERAESPQKVKSFYEISESFYEDGPSATRLIMLLAAALGPFAMIWILADQLGNPSSSVSFGLLSLLVVPADAKEQAINWLKSTFTVDRITTFFIAVAVVMPVPLLFLIVSMAMSPTYATILATIGLLGFALVPLLTQLLKVSDAASITISKLLLKLGLMGYDEPVLKYTPTGYKTVDAKNLDEIHEENISWHSFLGRKFGFTFEPNPAMWGNDVVDKSMLEMRLEKSTAVGSTTDTNIPNGYKRVPSRSRAGYGDYAPKRIKNNYYYVQVGTALEDFRHVAVGKKSDRRLTDAKEEFGGGSGGLDDNTIAKLMVVLSIVSLFAGIGVFLLPALL